MIKVFLKPGTAEATETTNEYISISKSGGDVVTGGSGSDCFFKLGGSVEVIFKLTEQATLDINYHTSSASDDKGNGGTEVNIEGIAGDIVSYYDTKTGKGVQTKITSGVALRPGTYKITRVSGNTHIASFSLTTTPAPDAFTTDITKGAVLDHKNAKITHYGTNNLAKFKGGFLDEFQNNDYAEFKVTNSKAQYFTFSFKAASNVDYAGLEIVYLKSNGDVIDKSGKIDITKNGDWTTFDKEVNKYSTTSNKKITTEVAKVKLIFYSTGSSYTANVRDLTLTPELDPAPDKDATVNILGVDANAAVTGTEKDGITYYKTIQKAVENAATGARTIIYVTPDLYDDQVNIGNSDGKTNKFISIISDDKSTAIISSDRHRGGSDDDTKVSTFEQCAAMNVYTQRFYGENITVKNTNLKAGGQAEALYTFKDGFIFNKSLIKGYQDTYRSKAETRGYFTNSTIVGAEDFVYADGTVWFENDEFQCLKDGNGYVFSPEDSHSPMLNSDYPKLSSFSKLNTSFFVNKCYFTAESKTTANSYHLGRPWKKDSGMLIMNSEIGAHINANGWVNFHNLDESTLTYLEYNNIQKDASGNIVTPTRPDWVKTLTDDAEELTYFTPEFIFDHMGTTKFEPKEILKGVNIPYDIRTEVSGGTRTTTWACSGAAGYILYKDGKFEKILTEEEFERTDDSYYAIRAFSRQGVMTDAIGLGGKTKFMYELPVTFKPECNILSTQNGITMQWNTNTPAQKDGKNYMKPSSVAFELTGEFKKDDLITLKIWYKEKDYDKDTAGNKITDSERAPKGFNFFENDTEKGEGTIPSLVGEATEGETYTLYYTVSDNCDKITIKRLGTNTDYYINNIKIERTSIITVKSPLSKMDVEFCSIELSNLSSIGTYLPKVRGEISGGGIYSGTPVFTVVDEDGNEDETVAKVENNMLVPVSKGTTKLKVTYNTLDYTVIPCYINVNVVGSCIRGLVATKNGTSNTISYTDSEIFTSVTGVFEINGNLACNMFYKGTTLKVTIGNPYPTGDVRFRYHVHEKSPVDENYQENVYNIVIENGGTNITLPIDFKNSFVIYAEHVEGGTIKSETVDGTTSRWIEGGQLVGTKTYEFIYIDDMTYFVGKPNEDIKKFDVTEYGKGAPSEGNHSVRGLKFSYGGLNENWTYTNSGDPAFTGPDGVLTYNGYSMVTAKDPKTETNEHYIHNNSTTVLDGRDERKSTISEGTFSLPVIGDYFRFEPEINGTIIVHVLQPGSTTSTTKKNLANRPLFFLDEAGKSQKLLSYSTTSKINFDEYNEVARYFYDNNLDSQDDDEYRRRMWNRYMIDRGYATLDPALPKIKESWKDDNIYWDEEKTRVKYGDGTVLPTSEGLIKPQEVLVLYSPKVETAEEYPERALPDFIAFRYEPDSKKAQYPDDLINMINDGQSSSFTRESMKDGTGYMLATAGFIKYAFDVKAGKTYNLFSYASKLGFCGYEFIPKQNVKGFDGLTKFECNQIKASTDNAESSKLITLSDKGDETNGYYDNLKALEDVEIGKQYDVKLEREFTANHWTPIVLPFSVSHTKLEKLFGTGTEVLHFDKITQKIYYEDNTEVNTLHLKKHYYDMIVAGTPVFIRPTFVDENGAAITEKSNFMFNNVTIELKDDSKLDCMEVLKTNPSNIKEGDKIIGKEYTSIKGCKFVCSLNALKIPYKGVYVAPSNVEGHGYMDRFYQSKLENQTISLKPLRGWIQTPVILTQKAKMTNYLGDAFDFGDETLGIDFIEINDGISTKTLSNGKIYNINGQMVGSALMDINTLPNGIYIVNGKKFTVNNK